MEPSLISIIGHAVTFLCFTGMIIYTYLRRSELRRSTQQSRILFYVIIGTSLLFALLNLFRLVYELLGSPENLISTEIDLIAQFSSISNLKYFSNRPVFQ